MGQKVIATRSPSALHNQTKAAPLSASASYSSRLPTARGFLQLAALFLEVGHLLVQRGAKVLEGDKLVHSFDRARYREGWDVPRVERRPYGHSTQRGI
jgi:hypothetical protein